jgi:NADH-quinone oxidoreductase subunit L
MLLGVSTVLIIAVIVYANRRFSRYQKTAAEPQGFAKLLANKWYVDELYNGIVVKPLLALGGFLGTVVEKSGIDKAVNGVGKLVNYGSRQLRLMQSGSVANYVLIMVVAIILIVRLVFYIKY